MVIISVSPRLSASPCSKFLMECIILSKHTISNWGGDNVPGAFYDFHDFHDFHGWLTSERELYIKSGLSPLGLLGGVSNARAKHFAASLYRSATIFPRGKAR